MDRSFSQGIPRRAATCLRRRIESEVVPGITAAVAAAAAAEISLTDRCHAEQVLLVSAHQSADKAGPDWSALVSRRTTIVVYMSGQAGEVAE
jgi:uroporphyrin-III C-methyltransferase